MKSAGKARSNGLYRHIRTSKEIIRNLLNDCCKNHKTNSQSNESNIINEFPLLGTKPQKVIITHPTATFPVTTSEIML